MRARLAENRKRANRARIYEHVNISIIFGLTDRDLCNRVRISARFTLFTETLRTTNQDLEENNEVKSTTITRKIHSVRKWSSRLWF